MITYSATYSAEDNKLRIYASDRLDSEIYQEVKDAGFKWAPKQKLFVAPAWSPGREDLCIKLAGNITAEQTTLVERAEAKVERLENLAEKRASQSNSFADAADRISERFYMGQPILIGHHSERKARKDKDAMERNQEKSIECAKAVDYWNYRAVGVAHNANYKNLDKVRVKRIKRLLAELRDKQRNINHGYIVIELWSKLLEEKDKDLLAKKVSAYVGGALKTGSTCPYGFYDKHRNGEMTDQQIIKGAIEYGERLAYGEYTARWINHLLNRLGYERSELGLVAKFEGDITAVILQAFAREHGAHKPKAELIDNTWQLSSDVPLPAHIGDGSWLNLTEDKWKNLMQSVGYEVIQKTRRPPKKQVCSLINPTPEQAIKLQELWNLYSCKRKYHTPSEMIEMAQSNYSANSGGDYGRYNTISLDQNASRIWSSYGKEKPLPICRVRVGSGGMYGADRIIVISDKPQKELPFDLDKLIEEAKSEQEVA